ncbi:MAG: FUSC family protein [Cetobacterium sp.]|uniref:FUSC family protein n=1 Tax=Cetobacterium sp. TaxID=2071632 RepID=UPI003F40687C
MLSFNLLSCYLSFEKRKINYHPSIILVILMGSFFFIGEYFGDVKLSLIAGLSPLVTIYFPSNFRFKSGFFINIFCLFGFVLAYFIGVFFSFNILYLALALGIFSTIICYTSSFLDLNPPKYFLFIMIASISAAAPYNENTIAFNCLLFLFTAILSVLFAYTYYRLILKIKSGVKISILGDSSNRVSLKKSLIVGMIIFSIYYFGKKIGLPSVHWIAISFTTISQASSRELVIKKGIQRMLGTFLGGLMILALFPINKNYYISLVLILILQFILEIFMQKNYLIAAMFFTPLTIIMADLSRGYSNNIIEIAFFRFICIIIGSLIGLGVGILTIKREREEGVL